MLMEYEIFYLNRRIELYNMMTNDYFTFNFLRIHRAVTCHTSQEFNFQLRMGLAEGGKVNLSWK